MQSDSQVRKNPYLVQYKNEISAKQKLLRERIGSTGSRLRDEPDSELNESRRSIMTRSSVSKDNIPSIDDTEQETRFEPKQSDLHKDQYSYFTNDDSAEASLQFFKKNLTKPQPTGRNYAPATGISATEGRPSFSLAAAKRNQQQTVEKKPYTETGAYDRQSYHQKQQSSLANFQEQPTKITSLTDHYQLGSGRPLPFKTHSSKSSRKETDIAKFKLDDATDVKKLSSKQAKHDKAHMDSRRMPLSEGASIERAFARQTANGNQALDELYNQKMYISDRDGEVAKRMEFYDKSPVKPSRDRKLSAEQKREPSPQQQHQQQAQVQLDRPDTQLDSGRQSVETPSANGTFSRKPLYNSLLRAHDSIRLKVNRPKVRPKSDVVVPDTQVDDVIQLQEINKPTDEPNERAVDVKRRSSRKKKDKKANAEDNKSADKIPVRNFAEVRKIKIERSDEERSIGVTVRVDDGNIVVARIMAGSLADKQGALQVGDIILAVNGREVYTPEQLQEQLRKSINDNMVAMDIVPSYRDELPTLCIYLRALFSYDANEDSLLPCKEVGVSFNQGDILEVVNQEDPNWWQARRVDSENLQTGLIPSQELEERRRAFVIPDYDLATRTSICGTKVARKSKKKEIYNVGQNNDFDKAELQLYEEVCRTPAFERRTLVLIGANGVGKQALKNRLITMDPERFGSPLPHTSRLPRDGEEHGVHYHFVTRERMEEDIIAGKYLEFGEYDGALYGTKLDSIREIIGSGKVCVLDCSATCLKILKTSDYLPFVAFIAAPTIDQLRYIQDWARGGGMKTYTTVDRALSRQSRRARTLQDFAFDFFEDEDLQITIEESARLFRIYENYFDIVLVNNNFERTFEQLREAIDALSMAPQWIPISWIYGT